MSAVANTTVSVTPSLGLPVDFGAATLQAMVEHGGTLERLSRPPLDNTAAVVAHIRMSMMSRGSVFFEAKGLDETEDTGEAVALTCNGERWGVQARFADRALEDSVRVVADLARCIIVQLAQGSFLQSPHLRRHHLMRAAKAEHGRLDGHVQANRHNLLGIAPVQWFGPAFVEAFGGDAVFEALPDGWAERVGPGLWKVFGVEDPDDPDAFRVESWSDRERALIEALGPQFFFNVETGELATEFVEIPIASQYPVYLWDEAAGGLVIHEPDGSTRPANLHDPAAASSASGEAAVSGPRALSHLVVERMTEVMGDVFVDDDQLYWVEQHLQVVPELDDVWVEAFSVWLGEHVIAGILDAEWVERDGRWVVSSSRGVFDPEPVVRATVGSEARGESRVMVSAACDAMGIPLP